MICDCTETSSAETASSQTTNSRFQCKRAGDADALALAAGELVRIPVDRLPWQCHQVQHLGTPTCQRWRAITQADVLAYASAMIAPTGLAGIREIPNGSWKHDLQIAPAAALIWVPMGEVGQVGSLVKDGAIGRLDQAKKEPPRMSIFLQPEFHPTRPKVSPLRTREIDSIHRTHDRMGGNSAPRA